MKTYTLKWRGTIKTMNIRAKTLKDAKKVFCMLEQVKPEFAIGRVQHIRKPSFQELRG